MAHSALSSAGRALSRAGAAMTLLGLVVGVPVALALTIGWPLPTRAPTSWEAWQHLLTGAIPDSAILNLLACAGWLLWAAFTRAVWVEARAAWRGVRASTRLPPRLSPLRGCAAFLVAAVTAGSLASAATASAPPAHAATPSPSAASTTVVAVAGPSAVAPATAPVPASAHAPLLPAGPGVLAVDGCGYLHTVAKGESLWAIAEGCLGNGERWPQIWQLNKGRFWPAVSGYKRLDNPDLIYPRWTLAIPAGAHPPVQTPQVVPTDPPPAVDPPPTTAPTATATATPAPTATFTPAPTTVEPDGVVGAPGAGTAVTAGTGAASPTGPTTTPTATPPESRPAAAPRQQPPGVSLPGGSWVDLGLALAIAAAVVLVWAHRRRRYTPRPPSPTVRLDEPDLAPMAEVVNRVRHGLRAPDPDDDTDADLDPPVAATWRAPTVGAAPGPVVPALANPVGQLWPPAGLGLTGPGAEAAGRGFLAAALAAGGLADPDGRSRVVIPAATLATLLGVSAVNVADTPRLSVTAALAEALEVLEEQTLHRTRIVYDYEVDNVAAVRRANPREEPLPPLILIADTAAAHERARIAALLSQGQRLDIHGILLGAWPDGDTVVVAGDGTTTTAETDNARHGIHPADIGRLAVLNPAETADVLAMLAESHTGQPSPRAHPDHPTAQPAEASDTALNDEKAPSAGEGDGAALVQQAPADDIAANEKKDPASADGSAPTVHIASTDPAGDDPGTEAKAPGPMDADDGGPSVGGAPIAGGGDQESTVDEQADGPGDHTADADAGDGPVPASAAEGAAAGVPSRQARVSVLGPPRLDDTGAPPGDPFRRKAMELLVYLAVHDRGATQEAILDDLLPSAPASRAPHRLDTYVYNLRKTLRRCAGPGDYLDRSRRRYALNPDLFDIDVWRLRDALAEARNTADPDVRVAAWRRAVDAYTGPLAEDCDYEWAEPLREGIRTQALDAHLALADAMADDPQQALAVLDAACRHSPYAEEFYRKAMRVHAALDNPDGVRSTLRTLERALEPLETEPSDESVGLAEQLLTAIRKGRDRTGRR